MQVIKNAASSGMARIQCSGPGRFACELFSMISNHRRVSGGFCVAYQFCKGLLAGFKENKRV
jgi:hypothetical protein